MKDIKDTRNSKELAVHYMATLIDVAREAFIILDSDLRVVSANPIFYQTFRVTRASTEGRLLYELGNGQWNIPEFKRLLEGVLPKRKVVADYEVSHVFEAIGKKTMLLNARQIDSVQLIILAIEDITRRKNLEGKLAAYTRTLEVKVAERTKELALRVSELERINRTMVGREMKMIDLKSEIKRLKKN